MEDAGTLTVGAGLDDPARLDALDRLRLDGPGDRAVFDRLTGLVTSLLDVPISLLTLVRPESQTFVSIAGLEGDWVGRGAVPAKGSFCQHAVSSQQPLVLHDATSHPLVENVRSLLDLDVTAYLGIPLVAASGYAVGSFCAIDLQPRPWSEGDVRLLEDLGRTVMAYVEVRPEPTPMAAHGLNIAAVAHRTGIGADTLRKWERRYGVLRPNRTQGGQRRYDDNDVARVEWLRDRLAEGFRISEAAALLDPAGETAFATVEALRDALVEAARAADPARLVALVEQAFALNPVETAIERIVQPALEQIGSGWVERSGAIAEEHLLTETVRARLERMLADRRPGVRGKAVLACGPDERHDLGLLALAVLLQADGWLVAYVGADIPLDAVLELAGQIEADVLCVSFTLPESYERFVADVADLTLPDGLRIVAGGAAVPQQPDLAETVADLRS
jgi:DNA-binding transcriptional MerR regulator